MSFYKEDICIPQTVSIPVSLYQSMKGRYFTGYADNLIYTGEGISAWAGLFNPPHSGVNLHVYVWTVTSLYSIFRAEIWFNATMPGTPQLSQEVTTSNFSYIPIQKPRVRLYYANNVSGEPKGGIKAFVRRGEAQSTIVAEEDGKFIFPPGSNFSIFISHPEAHDARAEGRIAYGWYEEPIKY